MIIPSIDLQGGAAVQLIGGAEMELDAGDPMPILERFAAVGEVAVVDLDAAMGKGDNAALIERMLTKGRCRVGGGIRSVDAALAWLDRGATKVVLGTAATPEVLSQLPSDRVVAALDAVDGEVVVEGWVTRTGESILERMERLAPYVSGFLVTFVEKEGRLGGTDMGRVAGLVEAAGGLELTIAGGVTTPAEVAQLDRLGAHAQVGMALYKGILPLADAFAAPLVGQQPWPCVLTDARGVATGFVGLTLEELRVALDTMSFSGEPLRDVALDDARTCLRLRAGAPNETEWGPTTGLGALERTLALRRAFAPEGSYTRRLFSDPELLGSKLREEARELSEASTPDEVRWEAADLLYFALTRAHAAGVTLADIESELDRRALRVRRRAGDSKGD